MLLVLAIAVSCAPALRAPPKAAPAPAGAEPAPSAPRGGEAAPSAAALLEEARTRFARRPDVEQVRKAEALFLAAAAADPSGVDGLAGAVETRIWRIDHERGADRGALAASALDAGQACVARAPASARCDYALALALGMQARERRGTALDGLKKMVEHLRRAAAAEPTLDDAGPARVLAIVLVRAPAWPLGPGDPEAGLEAARRAVALAPAYPPNTLALAEALVATGSPAEGRAAAERGVALARARTGDPDAPEWIRDGEALAARAAQAEVAPPPP
ncbi:tetratricopeptide repeat protein [Anaeromyxobacter oryzae]|uniref:Uncharacterized protein n=1 Tax=Anaeromyxobacter oryzae TaxID=2918170 RepID=A0ABM7WS04_9BACT|nr:hypothetical protein [Anaeromyxobacter oryzae]BDG02232.1 hypothetical protein AMOR_12280 [Anaeromyxobacter oryzae]